MNEPEIFSIPVFGKYILYIPLQEKVILSGSEDLENNIQYLKDSSIKVRSKPQKRIGPIIEPLFLGLITTRDCNLDCRYCDFIMSNKRQHNMTPQIAKTSVDSYIELLESNNQKIGKIQFFGGEPFWKNRIIELILPYARMIAARKKISIYFDVTTNGYMSQSRCKWISENFDQVTLSLDGPEEFQNLNRPSKNGFGSFTRVFENAKILSFGNCDLIIRVCVTSNSVEQLVEIASWIMKNFVVGKVCFEPLTISKLALKNSLHPPDPMLFAKNFLLASEYLEEFGIETMTSGVDILRIQYSFCPVGNDAIIINPDGKISACYQTEKEWEKVGLNFSFGELDVKNNAFIIDELCLDSIRSNYPLDYQLCSKCFCKYHCAGGCHISHSNIKSTNLYDDVCIQTRLIITGKLLRIVSNNEFYCEWLTNINKIRL